MKFKVGDIVRFKSERVYNMKFTFILEVTECSPNIGRISGVVVKDDDPNSIRRFKVNTLETGFEADNFELYPPAQTRLWKLLHGA